MEEHSSLEEHVDMGEMGQNETQSVTSGASPLTTDKRASIQEFIHAFEEKKRKKKKVKTDKEDDNVISFSPLTIFLERAQA